jgi:hypothetical protein
LNAEVSLQRPGRRITVDTRPILRMILASGLHKCPKGWGGKSVRQKPVSEEPPWLQTEDPVQCPQPGFPEDYSWCAE